MDKTNLRSGYTTGSCASAAARAAAFFALTGDVPEQISISLPDGMRASWPVVSLGDIEKDSDGQKYIATNYVGQDCADRCMWCGVEKDAGDDPDVTDGMMVAARVEEISKAQFECLYETGPGYTLPEYPNLYLTGGPGIGMVTKPGLSCPVGHYAINPVPRQMILQGVYDVCQELGASQKLGMSQELGVDQKLNNTPYLQIHLWAVNGQELAKKTFNPRLGVEDGISILGTTGIVKPMSEEALTETIRLDIRMHLREFAPPLILTPGNYGERFLQESMGIPYGTAVLCSNFVKLSCEMAVEEGAKELLFVSHIGKLIKVSAGIGNTHSQYGDGRMEAMADLVEKLSPEDNDLKKRILNCNTTDEALGILEEKDLGKAVLTAAACQARDWLIGWTNGKINIQVVTFSQAHNLVGMTEEDKR